MFWLRGWPDIHFNLQQDWTIRIYLSAYYIAYRVDRFISLTQINCLIVKQVTGYSDRAEAWLGGCMTVDQLEPRISSVSQGTQTGQDRMG
jgi:hypothetical protein